MSEYAPMKAVLFDWPFSDPNWVFERKLDGERCGRFTKSPQPVSGSRCLRCYGSFA
jgi:ATP-dependent DNA ligase